MSTCCRVLAQGRTPLSLQQVSKCGLSVAEGFSTIHLCCQTQGITAIATLERFVLYRSCEQIISAAPPLGSGESLKLLRLFKLYSFKTLKMVLNGTGLRVRALE